MSYEAIIGLEIHAELATQTKLFCECRNEFGGIPNSRICPICTGQPGTLPATNREAIKLALRACLAFGCEINRKSDQCRKHYFYPDLPKGYQISQRTSPLGINGRFEFVSKGKVKSVGIRQIHIEEDAGKLGFFIVHILSPPCSRKSSSGTGWPPAAGTASAAGPWRMQSPC